MSIELPAQDEEGKAPARKKKTLAGAESKIKAKVAWINSKGEVGLQFGKLSDIQRKQLEIYFKNQIEGTV